MDNEARPFLRRNEQADAGRKQRRGSIAVFSYQELSEATSRPDDRPRPSTGYTPEEIKRLSADAFDTLPEDDKASYIRWTQARQTPSALKLPDEHRAGSHILRRHYDFSVPPWDPGRVKWQLSRLTDHGEDRVMDGLGHDFRVIRQAVRERLLGGRCERPQTDAIDPTTTTTEWLKLGQLEKEGWIKIRDELKSGDHVLCRFYDLTIPKDRSSERERWRVSRITPQGEEALLEGCGHGALNDPRAQSGHDLSFIRRDAVEKIANDKTLHNPPHAAANGQNLAGPRRETFRAPVKHSCQYEELTGRDLEELKRWIDASLRNEISAENRSHGRLSEPSSNAQPIERAVGDGNQTRDELTNRKRVKMNTDGLKEYVANNVDAACHFVGDFAYCARSQGWTDQEIWRVLRPLTAKRAYEELMPHIEYVPPSVSPPPDSLERYAEGCAILADDPNVSYKPFRWLILRPLRDAIKQGREHGWFSRPPREQEQEQKQEQEELKPKRTHHHRL
jgi:hypothetical protein